MPETSAHAPCPSTGPAGRPHRARSTPCANEGEQNLRATFASIYLCNVNTRKGDSRKVIHEHFINLPGISPSPPIEAAEKKKWLRRRTAIPSLPDLKN